MAISVDLNADCGESFGPWRMGDDAAILKVVTSANIACGFHAGDPDTMHETLRTAVANGVAIGAHPGYDDRAGFGRRVIPMSAASITRMVAYQIGALTALAATAGAKVTHVKAHGALSNFASAERPAADAVAEAVRAVDPSLTLLAVARSELERAGEAAGLDVVSEIFADRGYDEAGQLIPRSQPGAMVEDPAEAAGRVAAMISRGAILTRSGAELETPIHSVCVHGDGPEAIAIARAVRERLEAAGVTVAPFAGR